MSIWESKTVYEVLVSAAERYPEKEAVIDDYGTVTYRELQNLVEQAKKAFLRLGLQPGETVCIWMPNSIGWVVSFLAVCALGGVAVAINTRYRTEEVEYILRQSDAVGLLFAPKVGEKSLLPVFETLFPSSVETALPIEAFPRIRWIVCHGSDEVTGVRSFHQLLEESASDAAVERDVDPFAVALIQYTSGTSSHPKGAMLTHDNIVRNAWVVGEKAMLTSRDVYLNNLPFSHVGGLVTSYFASLCHGSTVILTERFDAEQALRLIERHRCTVISGVETMLLDIMNHPDFTKEKVGSIERVIGTGTGYFVKRVYEEMGIQGMCTLYGLSEASPNVSMTLPNDPLELKMETCGKPHEGIEVEIRDIHTSEPMGYHQIGEIWVRGWNIMKGYYNKPEETSKTLTSDGWLRTGDIGELTKEGSIIYRGRMKFIIRVGGENVSPEEVENALLQYPGIKMTQVVGVPDERLGEVCMAFVELKTGVSLNEEQVIEFCRTKLAGFKVPRFVNVLQDWPLTGSGKIQRFKLQERALAELKMKG